MAKSELKDRAEEIEELVELSQQGNQEAFAQLYDIFVDPLYRYIFYRVNEHEVDDLLEMVFIKIWEKIKQYKKRDGASFSSWAFRIAHNMVIDHYRATKGKETDELDINLTDEKVEHDPKQMTKRVLDSEILKKALDCIKDEYKDILVYRFINQLSNTEISAVLDKSEGSIRILQHRALKALRKHLDKLGYEYSF